MGKIKNTPKGILAFITFIIFFEIWYFYLLYTGDYQSMLEELSLETTVLWIDVLLTVILAFAVVYGFLKAQNWARIYTLFYILWSAIWAIVMMVDDVEVIIHYLLFVIYVALAVYLLMSNTKEYFTTGEESSFSQSDEPYTFGEYTLFSKNVTLKSGRTQTIYFFSKKTQEDWTPVSKPENYLVGINKKTGIPYLKKRQSML
jgi:hypothetical protein